MALTEYRRKRHFSRTPEPEAKLAGKEGWSYVIQKHAASHLHYDFRIELDGVLKSWAVPKGPSLDPAVKRLAMAVEDHPVDYGSFEGIIPQGEYGGGTVLLWDKGSWEPIGDARADLQKGKLKFTLQGEKLKGNWTLIKTRHTGPGRDNQWLLIKERDSEARAGDEADVETRLPLSVVSGRDLDEIASSGDRVWKSNRSTNRKSSAVAATQKNAIQKKAIQKKATKKTSKVSSSAGSASAIAGSIKRTMPSSIDVQLATLTKEAPLGEEWLHEIKFDGYRMVCRIDRNNITFQSRNHLDWTARLSPLVEAARRLPVKQAIIDGEVVVLKPDGKSDFQALQNAFRDGRDRSLHYYAFDLLYLDGRSLLDVPLEERKSALEGLLSAQRPDSPLHYSEHVVGAGEDFHRESCRLGLEGSISKRRDQPYRPGRGYDWLKVKCVQTEEFVIGGFTEPGGSRAGFGALLMGYYDSEKQLHYAGKVGTGFDQRELKTLHQRLQSLEQTKSPFIDRTEKVGDIRTLHWMKPSLVAQIQYGSRTKEGILRHAVYHGLREDKPAHDVRLENAMPVEKAVQRAKQDQTSSPKKAKVAPKKKPASTKHVASKETDYDAQSETFAGVRLTHPEKVLYPESGITKLDLANYYRNIADWILPHILHRPLVLVRCPDGQAKECFYQKHPSVGTPEILRQIPIQESSKVENYVVVDGVEGLIALAQVGALEIHAWGSKEDKLERPDRLIFDMDPSPEVPWNRVVEGARQIRTFLQDLGLESFIKTTGGKGLHLVVPIERRHEWDEAKAFCKAVADAIVAAAPDQYTSNMSKKVRVNKIFLDYLRNGRGATAIVPYSTRARPGAPVSMPLRWDELSADIKSDHFTIQNSVERMTQLAQDPWHGIAQIRQTLTAPIKTLKKLGVMP